MEKRIYNTQQIRQIENTAFAGGVVSESLMERAGAAVFAELRLQFPDVASMVVLCGTGNNGGDGYVISRHGREAGISVMVIQSGPPKTQDAKAMAARAEAAGVAFSGWKGLLPEADVYVDALLGIGLTSAVKGELAEMIAALNQNCQVVAVDVPSGIDADTGAVRGVAVRAALTVTFIAYKLGLLTGEGASCTGKLVLKPLRLPADCYPDTGVAEYLSDADIRFPQRQRNSHKGNFGHVLIIGGDEGMGGSVMMTAEAALRSGAGRVTLLTHPDHVTALLARCPEVMVRGVDEQTPIDRYLDSASVVVIGPGLGRRPWGQRLWSLVQNSPHPLVVDADALYWMAQAGLKKDNWILTPHPGEAAMILDSTIAEVQENRQNAAQMLLARYGGLSVLKGAGSLIISKDGLSLCPAGNPGMATAGMGDVLAGVIGGLAAQFGASHRTVCQSVLVHAVAGDRAAVQGQRGLLATDLLPHVRELVNQ